MSAPLFINIWIRPSKSFLLLHHVGVLVLQLVQLFALLPQKQDSVVAGEGKEKYQWMCVLLSAEGQVHASFNISLTSVPSVWPGFHTLGPGSAGFSSPCRSQTCTSCPCCGCPHATEPPDGKTGGTFETAFNNRRRKQKDCLQSLPRNIMFTLLVVAP